MVTQVQWEDDIIWNGDDVRQKVLQNQKTKSAAAGWIPSSTQRTAAQLSQSKSSIELKQVFVYM